RYDGSVVAPLVWLQSVLGDAALENDQAPHVVPFELLAPIELAELDEHAHSNEFCVETLDQVDRGPNGAAGCQQVIYDDHALTGLDGVGMDLDRIDAVFQLVVFLQGIAREPPDLAH